MMRRRVVGALAAMLVAVLASGIAHAASSPPDGPWTGSAFDPPFDGSGPLTYPNAEVSGQFVFDPAPAQPDPSTSTTSTTQPSSPGFYVREVVVSVVASDSYAFPAGCAGKNFTATDSTTYQPPNNPPSTDTPQHAAFAPQVNFDCNGTYVATATACTDRPCAKDPGGPPTSTFGMTSTFNVAVPPPAVSGVAAARSAGRNIDITWDPTSDTSHDFTGYVVERQRDGGSFIELGRVANGSGLTDDRVPIQGGDLVYRVRAMRKAPVAGGTVLSDAAGTSGTSASVNVAPAPANSTTSIPKPKIGSGGVRLPAPTTTEADGGYSNELPYGEGDPNAQNAVGPDDGSFASVLYRDGAPRRGLLIPVASAMVLLAWAMHFRYLSHRAKQPV